MFLFQTGLTGLAEGDAFRDFHVAVWAVAFAALVVFVRLLPFGLLLAGCPIYGDEEPVNRVVQVSCVSDFDCPLDSYCDVSFNECVAFDFGVCLTDGDCGAAYPVCEPGGECVVACEAYWDCDDREVCDRSCVVCGCDADCQYRPGPVCGPTQARCVECLTDADCGEGFVCIDGVCVGATVPE